MEDAVKLKKILKQWEYHFLKAHNRKPNKNDIDAAPDNIKDTYREYTRLKSPTSAKRDMTSTNQGTNIDPKEPKDNIKPSEASSDAPLTKATTKVTDKKDPLKGKDIDKKMSDELSKDFDEPDGDSKEELGACANDDVQEDFEPKVDVWDTKFNKKKFQVDSVASSKHGGASCDDNKPSFLKKLGNRMYEQSKRLDKLQMGGKPGLSQWRKPDTPRRGLAPPGALWKPGLIGLESKVNLESDDEKSAKGEVIKNPKIDEPTEPLKDVQDDSDDTFKLNPALFGKAFEKAAAKTVVKGRNIQESGEFGDSGGIINRYQLQQGKTRKPLLPGNLSTLVSKHRETINFEEDIVDGDMDNFGESIDMVAAKGDDSDEEKVEVSKKGSKAGHSWDMPVSRLIIDDEVKERKKAKKECDQKVSDKKSRSAAMTVKSAGTDRKERDSDEWIENSNDDLKSAKGKGVVKDICQGIKTGDGSKSAKGVVKEIGERMKTGRESCDSKDGRSESTVSEANRGASASSCSEGPNETGNTMTGTDDGSTDHAAEKDQFHFNEENVGHESDSGKGGATSGKGRATKPLTKTRTRKKAGNRKAAVISDTEEVSDDINDSVDKMKGEIGEDNDAASGDSTSKVGKMRNATGRTQKAGPTRKVGKQKASLAENDDGDNDDELSDVAENKKNTIGRTRKGKRKANLIESDGDEDYSDKGGTDDGPAGKSGDVEMDEDFGDDNDDRGKKKTSKGKAKQPAAKKRKTTTGASKTASDNVDGESGAVTSTIKKPAARKTKPVSSDNFVKLNMKIKTYKRKGRAMTGPQYKRKMWKEKMQARSKSRGDACFKCGQSGHWANKCPGGGAQSASKYEKEPVQDEDFPSMQEAAMLSRGIKVQHSAKTAPTTSAPSQKAASSSHVAMETEEATSTSAADAQEVEQDEELEIESSITRTRQESRVAPPCMKPLIECGEGETIPETPAFVMRGLRKFGFEKFRPGQEEAVMRILCGLSTLVVLSTGGGKSLCYQLPAYLYAERSPCITLVISPLVSLMEDQVTGLPNGIRGVCLHTNMTPSQRENVLSSVKSGHAQFLLVSPEAIAGGSMSLIQSMSSLPPVAFVCIDEAHCLSEWSHNFRPSYLRLSKVLQDRLGIRCFLGLTATATMSTAADVSRHLKITDFKTATVRGSPIPANLVLSVSKDQDKDQALLGLLKDERFGSLHSIIIYCTRRDQTDKVATIIRTCMNTGAPAEKLTSKRQRPKLEWGAESYHAGLTPAARKRVQNAFMNGNLRVVVATVAFGMGLDKSDVRGVIHYNMPKSFESYVQEIGRAGRDGERADCHVFLDPDGRDLCELRRHTYANTVDYRMLKKLVQRVFPECRCRDVHERHAQALQEAEAISKIFDEEMTEDDFPGVDVGDNAKKDSDTNNTSNIAKNGSNGKDETNRDSSEEETVREDVVEINKNHEDSSLDESSDIVEPVKGDIGQTKSDGQTADSVTEQTESVMETESEEAHNLGQSTDIVDQTERVAEDIDKAGASSKEKQARLCPGHERALPIQQTVMELDVKEEGISTLLCYLELHDSQWLENMSNVYATCKVQCYGGPGQLQAVAKKCPPIGIAIAKARKDGRSFTNTNCVDFSVVEISDMMGWESGSVKRELKLLMWNFDSGRPVRTGIMVEFSDLAYHFRTPGDFTMEELDDTLQFLHERVQRQEKSELHNLSRLYQAMTAVAYRNYWMCSEEVDMTRNDKLKAVLNEYFDKQTNVDNTPEPREEPTPEFNEAHLVTDVRNFYNQYHTEHAITGRAIARVFHGIASPCFPATVWGRVRRFWRSHLDVDFNQLMKIATREIISFR